MSPNTGRPEPRRGVLLKPRATPWETGREWVKPCKGGLNGGLAWVGPPFQGLVNGWGVKSRALPYQR